LKKNGRSWNPSERAGPAHPGGGSRPANHRGPKTWLRGTSRAEGKQPRFAGRLHRGSRKTSPEFPRERLDRHAARNTSSPLAACSRNRRRSAGTSSGRLTVLTWGPGNRPLDDAGSIARRLMLWMSGFNFCIFLPDAGAVCRGGLLFGLRFLALRSIAAGA